MKELYYLIDIYILSLIR